MPENFAHSMHLIAMNLKKKFDFKWIADFRDPWTEVDYYHLLKIGKIADAKHHSLEKKVVTSADTVLTVSNAWENDLKNIGAKNTKVITNGYDESDFNNLEQAADKYFSIVHIGSIFKERNPYKLWKILGELVTTNTSFKEHLKIRLIGKTDFSVIEEIKKNNLDDYVDVIPYMSHNKIPREMKKARVLLLLISRFVASKGMIPGKVFEYLASQRPIVVLGNSKGDTARLINELNAGSSSEYEDEEEIKRIIISKFNSYLNNTDYNNIKGIKKYNRKNLTKELAEIC